MSSREPSMKLCSLGLLLSVLALALAPPPATASSAMYFTLQTDGQITLVSGPCSSNGAFYSCSPGNVTFHDSYGTCTANPVTGGALGGPPTYRCNASGTIAVKVLTVGNMASKTTCSYAIVQP